LVAAPAPCDKGSVKPIFQALGGVLEGATVGADNNLVRGRLAGQVVTFEHALYSVGSSSYQWTEVSVPSPPGLRLLLDLRPASARDEKEVKLDLAVDLRLGDPEFDAEYIVEGAPERIVRAILDEGVRRYIRALRPDKVVTSNERLLIGKQEWITDPERAKLYVEAAARLGVLASHFRAEDAADAKREQASASGYRGGPAAPSPRFAGDETEIATLAQKREAREARRRKFAIVLAVSISLVSLIAGLLGMIFSNGK
jgi:hypothetical protein